VGAEKRRLRSDPCIAIIGGGIGGIATAVKLRRAGFNNFVVYEKSSGAGGTWYDNTYPGCEVDIHSYSYSFSFMPYDWPVTHPNQATLRQYLEDTIDKFDLRSHFRFDTRVTECVWRDEDQVYLMRLADDSQIEAQIVVSCVGLLNDPKYPDWPGLDQFSGIKFHSARWEHSHDLSDKVVAFVGTGSTASQAVPAIAPHVKELKLFQREPGWVIPKNERRFSARERANYLRSPIIRRWKRYKQWLITGRLIRGLYRDGTRLNLKYRDAAVKYIEKEIHDPEVRRAVTPDFPFGCKRIVQASTFYSSLNRGNVKLIPHAVEKVTSSGVIAGGVEHSADVLIMATGFQPQNFISTLRVVGNTGKSLQEVWDGTAEAFLGITVPGFPNFFMIYGPNTNGGGSIVFNNERQAEVVVRIARRLRRGVTSVDTSVRIHRAWNRRIDKLADTRLGGQRQCHNYYRAPSGRNVTQLPMGQLGYTLSTWILAAIGLRSRREIGGGRRTEADALRSGVSIN
jgi:cation diffusion facilitator CzcD-associated flavoprotein CzcO